MIGILCIVCCSVRKVACTPLNTHTLCLLPLITVMNAVRRCCLSGDDSSEIGPSHTACSAAVQQQHQNQQQQQSVKGNVQLQSGVSVRVFAFCLQYFVVSVVRCATMTSTVNVRACPSCSAS
jgi:hypothetical protein